MTRSIPLNYSRCDVLRDEGDAILRRLAASLPEGLVRKIAVDLPTDEDRQPKLEDYTGWGPDMVAAYLMVDDGSTTFSYGIIELARSDFHPSALAEMEEVERTNQWVAAEAAAYRANEAEQVALSRTIGLVSTFSEDLGGGRLVGNHLNGDLRLEFETDEAAESFLTQVTANADDATRAILAGFGIVGNPDNSAVTPSR